MTQPAENIAVLARAVVRSGPRVLMARMTDQDFWYLPGDVVHIGESAPVALRRALREELGIDAIVGDIVSVVENAYELDGAQHQEVNLVFDVRLDGTADKSQIEGIELHWFDFDQLVGLDIRPPSVATVVRYGPGRTRMKTMIDGLPR